MSSQTSQTWLPGTGEVQNDVATAPRFDYYSEGDCALPRAQCQEPTVVLEPGQARR